MAAQAMDPNQQAAEYGFSYPPLPPRGLDPLIDRALDMVKSGVSPQIIRELDSWTGAVHFSYSGGDAAVQAASAPNSWVLIGDEYKWIDSEGQIGGNIPSWAPPKPNANLETGQYDIQRSVEVQYPGGSQPVTLAAGKVNYAPTGYGLQPDFRFDPNSGTYHATSLPQPDAKVGVPATSVPAGTQTQSTTTGNQTGALTMDEQVQAAALAGSGKTELDWDAWGFYWNQIYGEAAPAPEDRGYARAGDGSVFIGGRNKYPFSTWKEAAFGSAVGPGQPPAGAGAGSGAGAGAGAGAGGAGSASGASNYFLAVLAALVAGDAGWDEHVIG